MGDEDLFTNSGCSAMVAIEPMKQQSPTEPCSQRVGRHVSSIVKTFDVVASNNKASDSVK